MKLESLGCQVSQDFIQTHLVLLIQ